MKVLCVARLPPHDVEVEVGRKVFHQGHFWFVMSWDYCDETVTIQKDKPQGDFFQIDEKRVHARYCGLTWKEVK